MPYYQKHFSTEYNSFLSYIKTRDINQNTKNYFLNLWLRNFILNLEFLSSEHLEIIDFTQKSLRGSYVLFCGASPSLEDQIKEIKLIRNKLFLISSDTSASFLISQGIYPNAILSIDSSRGTIFHLRENLPKDTCFLTWFGANREIFFREFRKYLFFTTFPLDQILTSYFFPNQPVLENPSLNIAGIAKDIAKKLGAKGIIYAGVGFVSQDGKTHCRGTGYENYILPKINRKFQLESYKTGYKSKISAKNYLAFKEIFKDDFSILFDNMNKEKIVFQEVSISTRRVKVDLKKIIAVFSSLEILENLERNYFFSKQQLLKYLKILKTVLNF